LEYYSKHADIDVMHSQIEDKQKCLLKIGEVFAQISKPQEFFNLNK
jgi:hypothetical protein